GRAYQAGLGGLFAPLSPLLVPVAGSNREDLQQCSLTGASADRSHLYFKPGPGPVPSAAYLPGDPEPNGSAADHDTYVAHLGPGGEPELELLARDGSGKVWGGACGSRLGGIRPLLLDQPNGERNPGALSPH